MSKISELRYVTGCTCSCYVVNEETALGCEAVRVGSTKKAGRPRNDDRTGDWEGGERGKGGLPGEMQQQGKREDKAGRREGNRPSSSAQLRIRTSLPKTHEAHNIVLSALENLTTACGCTFLEQYVL